MKLYKKQIRPIAKGGAWQGFNPESTPLSDCIDIEDRKEHVTKKNEMCSLYEKISESNTMRMTWIKNKLPWYITKFCKISSTEMSLRGTSIFIGVNFGKSCEPNCYIEITPRDIGWI